MRLKISSADIYSCMLCATPQQIAQMAARISTPLRGETAHKQLLGLASALICAADRYDIEVNDVLHTADTLVYSGESTNMADEFKNVKHSMRHKWEI